MSMIPCITWIKKGVAKQSPEQVQITKEELEEIIKNTKGNIEDIEDENEQPDVSDIEEGATCNTNVGKKKKSKMKRKHDSDNPDGNSDDDDDVIDKYGLDDYDMEEDGHR